MAETSSKREEPGQELIDLSPVYKGAEGDPEDQDDAGAQLAAVGELGNENGFWRQTVRPQEKGEVRRGEIEVDVFHAQKSSKNDATGEQSRPSSS